VKIGKIIPRFTTLFMTMNGAFAPIFMFHVPHANMVKQRGLARPPRDRL
jgi:hypothetical protein